MFPAKYAGECADCGEQFQVGEHIKRAGDWYAHGNCAAELMQASARPVCGKCWLEVPPSGECGCYA